MNENFYKLGEYKIIESDFGELRWETHFGLGMFQEGRCFRKGVILFIGPAESHHNGFLKLEFNDHLKKFPDWLKTKYYCKNLEVFHCKTGKKVSRKEMRLWMFNPGAEGESTAFSDSPGNDLSVSFPVVTGDILAFRLQRYEINKKADGRVVWKTYAGLSTLRVGTCIILEDILFLGQWQDEQTDLIKRQFVSNLKKLPQWNQTKYFCHTFPLRECKTLNLVKEYKKGDPNDKKIAETEYKRAVQKKRTELKTSPEKPRQPFSPEEIMKPLQSLFKPSMSTWDKFRFFEIRHRRPKISKSISAFHALGAKKWLIGSAALMLVVILLFLFFWFENWDERHEKRHYKKESHPSEHRRDH